MKEHSAKKYLGNGTSRMKLSTPQCEQKLAAVIACVVDFQHEQAPRPQYPRHFCQSLRIASIRQNQAADDHVKRAVTKRERLSRGANEFDLGITAEAGELSPRDFDGFG